jgi:cytochrome P450
MTQQLESWESFTPHRPEFIADPLPAYRWLRRNAPVFHVESEDIWVLSRHADVAAAARDWTRFSQRESVGYSRIKDPRPVLTATDPPLHTELRRHTAPLFTPRAVATYRPDAAALLDSLLDPLLETGQSANFADGVANPYLSRLVGSLMGIPFEDLPVVKDGATAASLAMAGDYSDEVMAGVKGFQEYFTAFVASWAQQEFTDEGGKDGVFTRRLFEVTPSGRQLTYEERLAYETLLATGGNETTAQMLSNLLLTLSEQPAILERLRREPGLRPAAVEESLRYISPVTGLFRHTACQVTVAGTVIPEDAKVLLMYGSANHDEARYDRPDDFVIDRFPKGFADADHLSFTTGVHVCLGAHLARMLIDVFFDRMADRVQAIEITGPVRRSHNALVRVIDDLPVRLTPR